MNVGDNAREAENRADPAANIGVFLFSVAALFFYAALVGLAAAHLGYWQTRYMLIHALFLGMAYAAAILCGMMPRWRDIGGAIGTGVGIASSFSLILGTSINPLEIVAGLFLTILSLLTGNFVAVLVLGGFVASNILLVWSCARHTTWHKRETTFALIGTLIFAVGTGPLTGGIQKHEAAQVRVARDEGQRVPALIYGLQACLVRYAQASSPGAYPARLGEINAIVPACVSEQLADGKTIDGFRYSYTSSTDAKGRPHFTLSADGVRSVGILHIAFASDDTFVLRHTDEAKKPAAEGRSFVFPTNFGLFLGSIRNYAVLKEKRETGKKRQANFAPMPIDSMEFNYPATLAISLPAGYFPRSTELRDEDSFADATYQYRNPRVLGMADDTHLVYAVDEVTGISALRTADASPVWTLAGGINGVAGRNEFYALSESDGTTILQRINASGEVAWRFSATGANSVVRAANDQLPIDIRPEHTTF